MSGLLQSLYWLALAAVVYPYIGYPLALWVLTRLRGAYVPAAESGDFEPSVSLMISAYNEDAVIDTKLRNARALDYPADKLQIIVVSDASTDDTDDIVRAHAAADPRVLLHRQDERRGKTAGLNRGIEFATGDIVVFSDANALYEPGAIRALVAPLRDPDVGYVVGAAHYSDSDRGEAQQSEGLYWRYELALKKMESACASVVGGDGAIYAIRRHLFWPLRDDDINDLVNPLQIIAAGYRGVFTAAARCHEQGADSFAKEFRRKRRIVNRSWRATKRYGPALRTTGNGAFIFQLVSHKILRWFALPFLLVLALANVALADAPGIFYKLSLAGLTASVVLAIAGHVLLARGARPPRISYLFYYFYLVNLAALLGILDESRGIRHSKWEHVRNGSA